MNIDLSFDYPLVPSNGNPFSNLGAANVRLTVGVEEDETGYYLHRAPRITDVLYKGVSVLEFLGEFSPDLLDELKGAAMNHVRSTYNITDELAVSCTYQ